MKWSLLHVEKRYWDRPVYLTGVKKRKEWGGKENSDRVLSWGDNFVSRLETGGGSRNREAVRSGEVRRQDGRSDQPDGRNFVKKNEKKVSRDGGGDW